jgi:hypothetical protein
MFYLPPWLVQSVRQHLPAFPHCDVRLLLDGRPASQELLPCNMVGVWLAGRSASSADARMRRCLPVEECAAVLVHAPITQCASALADSLTP